MAIVGAVSTSAMAADGTINFTGEIIAASCTVKPGNGGTSTGGTAGKQTINVELGKVSSDSLGTIGNVSSGKSINLDLDCGTTGKDLTTVKLTFDPANGSGLDTANNSLLKITGPEGKTATGVAIGLYDSNNKLLNLAANETIDGKIETISDGETPPKLTYKAKLDLRAGYVATGAVTPGIANGTLPFTLTYQ
ncbi:fimbrial protein [Pseudomonas chlororaphis]|uniref:Fimbrial protein n=2 Tax=Pseudomonas chlororaphis TaxID=587753 RepID=A0A0D5XUP8_9PSED|nr:fimbrial protein [Pseudomonas chlororaphis]